MITSVDSAISILVVTAIIIKVAVIIRSRKMATRRTLEQLDSLVPEVLTLASKYDDLLSFSSGYLIKKDYDELRADAAPVVATLLKVPAKHRQTHPQAKAIAGLLTRFTNQGLRKQYNNEFKAHERAVCATLFDDVSGRSLDNQQRDAIVTDEYSNLVIAGAGSGKTLTVVGKLKYLVEHWGVDPTEILVTSFTRKSVDELADRIAREGLVGISTKTFHSLGLSVLNKPGVANENELKTCILRYLSSEILESPKIIQAYLEFYGCYRNIPEDYGKFESDGDRIQELKSMDLLTLKGQLYGAAEAGHDTLQGEKVKSVEELIIANHLFLNEVKYEYEKPYPGEYKSNSNRAYQPDFYLPDYDLWLEHFGINDKGRAPWLGTPGEEKKYLDGIVWKRAVHKQNMTKLIESYSFWNKHNQLIDKLDALLMGSGVALSQNIDELVKHYELLRRDGKLLRSIVELISTFVSLFKANNMTMAAVNEKAMTAYLDDKFMRHRYQLFIAFVGPIIEFYKSILHEKGLVDFDDMINHATQTVLKNGIHEHYKYIIVDEFQDISASRFGLINAIRDKTGAKLVCVGDDWQSIYRFAGSDVSLFTHFDRSVGFHEKLRIENTYRNSQSLIDTASKFITQNPCQLPKVMVSRRPQQNPCPITVLSLKSQIGAVARAIDEILSSGSFTGSILILGRMNTDWDSLLNTRDAVQAPDEILGRFTSRNDTKGGDIDITYRGYSKIKFITAHRAKGLEADEVIVLNLINDKYGFPNKIVDDPLLNLLLADSDDYQYAEERRLFYVAITRTRNRVYLITSHAEIYKGPSVFVTEILNGNDIGAIRLVTDDGERAPTNWSIVQNDLTACNCCIKY